MTDEAIKEIISAKTNLALANAEQRKLALEHLASLLEINKSKVMSANKLDIDNVKAQKDEAFIDRMTFTDTNYESMVDGVRQVQKLDEIIGKTYDKNIQASGITTQKIRIPIGVILMIYESRPNVTIDAAALAIKSGNVMILKGGSETSNTNAEFVGILEEAFKKANLPVNSIKILTDNAREVTTELLNQADVVDLVIPRGSRKLLKFVQENSKIPVLMHLEGNCHTYIDEAADQDMAIRIAVNAKTQRFGTCNTMETLLIHKDIANDILPNLSKQLVKENVELRGDQAVMNIIDDVKPATEEDWKTEFLAPILAVKIVESTNEAIEHINKYGSGHTDAIVTQNKENQQLFIEQVDSASVMVNTSTRFADGFEYGLGAEIGISTGKLHARGPVGLEGLTTYKWVVTSDGKTR